MNQLSFEEALYPHYDDALKYCITLTAKALHTEAQDLLQDALLKAIQKFRQLENKDKFRPWLFQIITRTYLSKQRLKHWKRMLPLSEHVLHIPDVFDGFVITEKRQVLLAALGHLSNKQRTALLLFEIGGFSIQEIKRIQGDFGDSAVKSRLSRARLKMRRIIEALEGEESQKKEKTTLNNLDQLIHDTTQAGNKALHEG